jgi:hypothetical protein
LAGPTPFPSNKTIFTISMQRGNDTHEEQCRTGSAGGMSRIAVWFFGGAEKLQTAPLTGAITGCLTNIFIRE